MQIKETVQKSLPPHGKVHALHTRQSAAVKFISMHILVPGEWTVSQGHALVSKIESEILAAHPDSLVFTHVEPLDTPAAHEQSILSEYDF